MQRMLDYIQYSDRRVVIFPTTRPAGPRRPERHGFNFRIERNRRSVIEQNRHQAFLDFRESLQGAHRPAVTSPEHARALAIMDRIAEDEQWFNVIWNRLAQYYGIRPDTGSWRRPTAAGLRNRPIGTPMESSWATPTQVDRLGRRYYMQTAIVVMGDTDREDHTAHVLHQNMGYDSLGRRRTIFSVLVDAADEMTGWRKPHSALWTLCGTITSFVKRRSE